MRVFIAGTKQWDLLMLSVPLLQVASFGVTLLFFDLLGRE